MLFISLMKMREGKMQSAMAQRIQWEYPEGVKMIGEYWLTTNDPKVISIYEVDSHDQIMELETTWDDAFDVKVFSAITAEDGIAWVKKLMG